MNGNAHCSGRWLGDEPAVRRAGRPFSGQMSASATSSRDRRDVRQPRPSAAPLRAAGLTPREVEVAVLVARGLRNRDIADVLVIT